MKQLRKHYQLATPLKLAPSTLVELLSSQNKTAKSDPE